MSDPTIHPIDEHSAGEQLHHRQKHYEEKLKNGGKTLEDLSRGVSAILAGQMDLVAKVENLATRTEVHEMIESHATTCALARGGQAVDAIEIPKLGVKLSGKSVAMFLIGLAFVAVVAVFVMGPAYAAKQMQKDIDNLEIDVENFGLRGMTNIVFSPTKRGYDPKTRTYYLPLRTAETGGF